MKKVKIWLMYPLALALFWNIAHVHSQGARDGTVTLPEIVIIGTKIPAPADQIGSSVSIVSEEQIGRSQAKALADVLREVPGLAVSKPGPVGAYTQIRIRGSEGNHALVIIDGVEINDPSGNTEFDFGNMPASDVSRIEILRGPQSALYGSDALGGVINIITKKGEGPPSLGFQAELGTQRTALLSTHLKGGDEKLNYYFGVSGSSTDGFSVANTNSTASERDGNKYQNFNTKIGLKPTKDLEFKLYGRFHKSTQETDDQPAVAGKIFTVDNDDKTQTQQRTIGISTKYSALEGAWEHIGKIAYNDDRSESTVSGSPYKANGSRSNFSYQTNYYWATPELFLADQSLSFLIEKERDFQDTSSIYGKSNLAATTTGYSSEYRASTKNGFSVSLGARYDDNDLFQNRYAFRSAAAYKITDKDMRVHGSIGTGAKNPTLFELYGFGPNFTPNSDLKTETSIGWDLGVEKNFPNNQTIFNATYFKNLITDLINGAGTTAINTDGTSVIQGLELSIEKRISDVLNLRGQYTFTMGQDSNRTQLTRRPKHIASLNLNYQFSENRGNFNIGIDYTGTQTDTEFSQYFAESNRIRLSPFLLMNVAASFEVWNNFSIYGRIENILDTSYEEALSFGGPGISGTFGIRTTTNF
ncbi:MAG: TonB-dependent receptor [Pseudomonadota bacterium]|nr:TonB-dependent receptor [Pseudomonadota bacterium]